MAKTRINVRFRSDLLERIDQLVLSGRVKNLTEFLEGAAEARLARFKPSENGKVGTPSKSARRLEHRGRE